VLCLAPGSSPRLHAIFVGEKWLVPKFDNKGKRGLREITRGSLWDLHKEINGMCALIEDPIGIQELIQLLCERS
jgi:hypothetical protein